MRIPALKISGTIILLTVCVMGYTQKTDKVLLKNGDLITGEIKSMKLAKLSFDMSGPGIISIKWEEIVKLRSDKTFQVTTQGGQVLLTKLDTVFFETQQVGVNDIVEIVKIRRNFWKRLSGDINLGFSYTKSSDIIQFNFNSSTTYRKPKMEATLKLNTVLSKSGEDTITSKKQDATITAMKTLNNQFYFMSNLGWEENTQLGLANRVLVGAGAGKIILNDNHQRLLTGAGLSYNREQSSETSGYVGNLEVQAVIQFKKFRYSTPKVSIDAGYIIYPSLSNWGRVRMNLQVNTSFEIFKDFSVGFTFYDNYDNRPPSGAVSTNDYGVTFTMGYIFGR